MSDELFKDWYNRGYLPHYDHYGVMQSITFRLSDSLPYEKVSELNEELKKIPVDQQDTVRRTRIEGWLDAGYGNCALKYPDMARVMLNSLLRFDGKKYRLIAWCIMPNHVHVLIEPLISLSKILQSWKSYTGKWAVANGFSIGSPLSHKFWMPGYWDRYIRGEKHFKAVVEYIHNNPTKAKLCRHATNWQWSSAKAFIED